MRDARSETASRALDDGPDHPEPRDAAPGAAGAHQPDARERGGLEQHGVLGPSAFTFVNGSISIALLAAVAHVTGSPWIFPSLGPTAFLVFHRPLARSAAPRNAVYGHLIGALVGWLSLAAFGLLDAPPALGSGVGWPRVGAAALSLGGTSGLMVALRAVHPPAGATTLIVSLGLMPRLEQIPVLLAAVLLLLAQAVLINRLTGTRYPLWSAAPVDGTAPVDGAARTRGSRR